ncbi:MAG: hypothetical protein HZC51_02380 [Nitrospirae bacterium]|nr:hypothetical protein [Nitrospirota bacterium]
MSGKVMKLIPLTLVVGLAMFATQAFAKDNYCAECHTADEVAAFGNVIEWDRSVFQVKDTLCPGMLELKKDAYFTESRLANYREFLKETEESTRRYTVYKEEDLDRIAVKYADLASVSPASIGSFTGPNLKIKKSVHEIYENLNKLRGDYRMEKVVGFGLVGVMLITFLLHLGLKNTLKE